MRLLAHLAGALYRGGFLVSALLSGNRCKATLVLIFLFGSGLNEAHAQRRSKAAVKKPETTQDAAFDPAKLTKLAIVVTGRERTRGLFQTPTDQQRLVEEQFIAALLQKGYTLASRTDMQSVVKEQQFQNAGLTEDNAAALGKLLNVPAVLVLQIQESTTESQRDPRTGRSQTIGRATMSARLISVESGGIWWMGKLSESGPVGGRSGDSLVLEDVAKKIAAAFPDKPGGKSSDSTEDFDPAKLTKLAVVVVGRRDRVAARQSALAPRVVIRPRNTNNEDQGDRQRLVEDEFLQALIGKGYSLVSRSDMQAIVKEQQFQQSGLTEDNAAAAGKLLNVPAVLVVSINECTSENQRMAQASRSVLMGQVSLGARLIGVESGGIWWARPITQKTHLDSHAQLTALLARAAKELAASFPAKNGPEPKADKKAAKRASSGN
jgi:hypothetical protein